MARKDGNLELVDIRGESTKLSELEDNIFKSIGVRIIIRCDISFEVFVNLEKRMSDQLSLDETVGIWTDLLRQTLSDGAAIGRRSVRVNYARRLQAGDIVFISPKGTIASGQTLVRNLVWEK